MIAADLNKLQALDADNRVIQKIDFSASLDRARNIKRFFISEEAK